MKKILLTLCLLISFVSFSQDSTLIASNNNDVFNEEWYQSLDEKINFITFKRTCETTLQFRIYRGDKDTYKVSIVNSKGIVVRTEELNQVDEIDISNIYPGVYTIKAEDCDGNTISKELIVGG